MADEATPGTAPITDRRTPPRGVLPRRTQTWLMVALALGILGVIVFTGHPERSRRPASMAATTAAAAAPNPDRLRDYQERMRVLDERARQQQLTDRRTAVAARTPYDDAYGPTPVPAPPDPLVVERRRRDYES